MSKIFTFNLGIKINVGFQNNYFYLKKTWLSHLKYAYT